MFDFSELQGLLDEQEDVKQELEVKPEENKEE